MAFAAIVLDWAPANFFYSCTYALISVKLNGKRPYNVAVAAIMLDWAPDSAL